MSTKREFIRLVGDIGRAGVHALFPNDFEYYLISLELVDSRNNTIDMLTFPIMPDSISRSEQEISSIKKSAGGMTVLGTNTFHPVQFQLSGNFGRSLKLLVRSKELSFSALSLSTQSGIYSRSSLLQKPQNRPVIFSQNLKSGYGITKILAAIVDKSRALDDYNRPFRLFFYNPSFGESYVVRATNLTLSQNKDASNAIWNYSLELKAIANLEALNTDPQNSLRKLLTADVAQKFLTRTAQSIKRKYIN